jgi:hypothetical protein
VRRPKNLPASVLSDDVAMVLGDAPRALTSGAEQVQRALPAAEQRSVQAKTNQATCHVRPPSTGGLETLFLWVRTYPITSTYQRMLALTLESIS